VIETINGNYTIKQIFEDNWERFQIENNNIRPTVIKEVEKILACKDKEKMGWNRYECAVCGYSHYVAHTCKSRFCNSCGKIMTDNWIVKMERNFFNVPYHHLVFHPPSELWLFFLFFRPCLNFLFKASSKAVLSWCKEQGFLPGLVLVMHTFSSDLLFSPHIHMLLSEGGLGEKNDFDFKVWQKCGFFPEKVLKERFKYYLVKYSRDWSKKQVKLIIPNTIKQIWKRKYGITDLYSLTIALYKIIWYVHIGERLSNASYTTRYIGRYAKRPAISETKIVYYSFEEQTVRFSYKDKISKTHKTDVVSVNEFVGRLIKHIPEKNFRMIRHYGFYANAVKNKLKEILEYQVRCLFGETKLLFEPKTWKRRILEFSGRDPLMCPVCKVSMKLREIAYRARDGTLKTISV
jgi:hypothetical protein